MINTHDDLLCLLCKCLMVSLFNLSVVYFIIVTPRLMETNRQQVEGHSMIAVKYSKDLNSNQNGECHNQWQGVGADNCLMRAPNHLHSKTLAILL